MNSKKTTIVTAILLALFCATFSECAETDLKPANTTTADKNTQTQQLQNLFVVGDSISMQYGTYLQTATTGIYNYARKTGKELAVLQDANQTQSANGGDSARVLAYLTAMKNDPNFTPDVLLINCGLHDIKTIPQTDQKQVTIDKYAENLKNIVSLTKDIGAKMVWLRTTPVDDARHNKPGRSFFRYNKDVIAYNKVADSIMQQGKIPTIDLYKFTDELKTEGEKYVDHVHYNKHTRKLHAEFIAKKLAQLAKPAN